jgi:hypothetical protein
MRLSQAAEAAMSLSAGGRSRSRADLSPSFSVHRGRNDTLGDREASASSDVTRADRCLSRVMHMSQCNYQNAMKAAHRMDGKCK